jgi:hypothetical protein
VAEFDDARLRGAMQAYLEACDALETSDTGEADGPREFIERADAKTLAEMVLRGQLVRLGWTAPREHAPADKGE